MPPKIMDEFSFSVNVRVRNIKGPKQTLGAILEALEEAIKDADPDEVDIGESTYEITDWKVEQTFYDGRP